MNITYLTENIEMNETINSNIYLFGTGSVYIQNNSQVTMAPYNGCYCSSDCIIPNGENRWNKPEISKDSKYIIMEPSNFEPFVVPYGDEPKGILAPLPSSYTKALKQREAVAEERRQLVLQLLLSILSARTSI